MNAKRMLAVLALFAACCVFLAGCMAATDGGSSESGAAGSVDAALEEAAAALDDARNAVSEALSVAGDAVGSTLEEVAAALEEALAGFSTNLQDSLETVGDELGRTSVVEVVDAQDGSAVATVSDEAAIADVFSGLDYASWRLAEATPDDADARYVLRCMESSVGLLDAGELYEVVALTTYDGGYLGLSVLGASVAVFEVPQTDVDALNALAG